MIQEKLIHQNCIQCHGGTNFPGIQMLQFDDIGNAKRFLQAREGQSALVIPKNAEGSELYQRIMGINQQRQMPPMGFQSPQEQQQLGALVKQWIENGAVVPQ